MNLNKNIKNILKCGVWGIGALIPPAAFFYLLECYTHNPFAEVRPWAQLFNVVLFELLAGILFCLTGRLRTAYRILGGVSMVYGIANAYVVRFRTNPIVPWDILSWRTAASVAGNYDFAPDKRMIVVTIGFVGILAALSFVKLRMTGIAFWKRCIPGVCLAGVLALFAGVLQQESFQNAHRLYNKLFTPVFMTEVDGIPVTFVMNLAYMSIEKPKGYSIEEAEGLLAQYGETPEIWTDMPDGGTDEILVNELGAGADETLVNELDEGVYETLVNEPDGEADSELPNIIVVMNEAFSDLSVLGDFRSSRDATPYLHSLQEGADNTVTGMLNVSVCGGNTANTEFEFLTGNTMAFLPQGSIPYQQYITGERLSMASYLKELGYQTVATHPYNASGWERDTVYPWLGFDESIFKEGYYGAQYVRDYVSDLSCVQKIIQLYEEKEEGVPLFVFNVTMQNHGGYQDISPNFTPEITVEGTDNVSLEQYLSLIKLSDQSLEQLISYFSGVDEKTVVVFFGDHQPGDAVAEPILAMNGMHWNTLDEEQLKLRYQVPYVIWANYDIEEEQNADTSANYLGAQVLARAGVPVDAYRDFLLEMKEEYPILSAVRTVTADGAESQVKEEQGKMDSYRKLQYYMLFDWKEES